jgi:hypothetical protein
MPRSHPALRAFALAALLSSGLVPASGATATEAASLEIADFSYRDTSGEATDQTALHQTRLQAFMAALRHDVGADSRYRLLPSSCATPCTSEDLTPDRLHAAAQAGAHVLVVGGIHKMSTLVQWAKVSAVDTETDRLVFEKLYTFRGDTDEAWQRAEAFVSQEIRETLVTTPAAASAPVKLAVFDFELEDTSAAAATAGETASDAVELAKTTDAVRTLLAQSGRYTLVSVDAADAPAAKTHTLRDCDGCDAGIAAKLGADQSLVGVVRRVSRTEYTVRFKLRDTHTGDLVSGGDSGLRIGANYSWSRGARRLVDDRLLAQQAKQ